MSLKVSSNKHSFLHSCCSVKESDCMEIRRFLTSSLSSSKSKSDKFVIVSH